MDFHRGRQNPERWEWEVSKGTNSWDSGHTGRLRQPGYMEDGGGIHLSSTQSEGPHGLQRRFHSSGGEKILVSGLGSSSALQESWWGH